MNNNKLTKKKKAVYEVLKKAVYNGQFRPGQRLIERELCELLQVSRTPLREALNKLVIEGLLKSEPYIGIVVPRLSVKEIMKLIEVREVLESLSVKNATKNITNKGLKKMHDLLVESNKLLENRDIDELVKINHEFHHIIAFYSDNYFVKETLERLDHQITLARSTSLYVPYRAEKTVKEHFDIYNAMVQGNSILAQEKMAKHIINAGKTAIKETKESNESSIKPIN